MLTSLIASLLLQSAPEPGAQQPSPGALHTLVRMSYTVNEDGSVRQFGEPSTDHGVSWQSAFDFTCRPKEDASE
ncbi:MAG: hypothetical protein O3C52_05905 [Proteobacteria bacterium]|nr:hypothetical protein [Pseudomonadota bacterium]MDA0914230.1 hypothetical protein [Pseudomonadota bacterium]MDA1032887.1 hypothetical protein [Pseudomonadota bacterium]